MYINRGSKPSHTVNLLLLCMIICVLLGAIYSIYLLFHSNASKVFKKMFMSFCTSSRKLFIFESAWCGPFGGTHLKGVSRGRGCRHLNPLPADKANPMEPFSEMLVSTN